MTTFQIGTRVQGGKGEDHDTGTVATAPDHAYPIHNIRDAVWVAWDSGVAAWSPVDLLSPA